MDDHIYEIERKASIEAEHSDAEHYDKWLITLASGAFGISIAFLQHIAPHPLADSKKFLVIAWVGLLVSIFATMLSLQSSQWGFRRLRDILDQTRGGSTTHSVRNFPAGLTKFLNWLSLLTFFAGAAALAMFSFLNLGG